MRQLYTDHHNSLGQFEHLIRVNGRRSVIGVGHTRQEAYRNAIDAAKEVWTESSHIFEFLKPLPAHKALSHNKI